MGIEKIPSGAAAGTVEGCGGAEVGAGVETVVVVVGGGTSSSSRA